MKHPNLLYLGQYPLDRLDSAPKIRTHSLLEAFKQIANVTFITGTRNSRKPALLEHLQQFPHNYYDLAYLEAATSTSNLTDFRMLYTLKTHQIPLGIFIRDAYQLFGMSPRQTLKEKILYQAWFASQYVYQKTATVQFYPTWSLAKHFTFPRQAVLPPAARLGYLPNSIPENPDCILYAGNFSPENGGDLLFESMAYLVQALPRISLLVLSRSEIPQKWRNSPWILHLDGTLDDLKPYSHRLALGIIPRPLNNYNHLSMPIKLMDYFSLGLPVVVTACREMASFVSKQRLGQVASADPISFANAIQQILVQPQQRKQYAKEVNQAVLKNHNWQERANTIIHKITTK